MKNLLFLCSLISLVSAKEAFAENPLVPCEEGYVYVCNEYMICGCKKKVLSLPPYQKPTHDEMEPGVITSLVSMGVEGERARKIWARIQMEADLDLSSETYKKYDLSDYEGTVLHHQIDCFIDSKCDPEPIR
ncbi:MAG: hypothetical protein CL678_10630 [Bdellovibrionaceae bacterium]|nr:hypothetical protein [Pseudobdellovibrionaceae bacterium]|tara:strand:- start:1035 stop:1430 length:396 start_codon:yes stop_codon:yes gene_type:complete